MARGTTLQKLVADLRIEARYDPDPALSRNMKALLERTLITTQEFLYDEFDWPFLQVYRDINLEAGSRYYDFPADMNLERVQQVDVYYSGDWRPVDRHIDLQHYNAHDSDHNERTDPVLKWDIADLGQGPQLEVWPLPASPSILRITGIRNLGPMVNDEDRADLDDMMIVLYAAGEMLASSDKDLSAVKLQKAKARRDTMQGRTTKTRTNRFSLGGTPPQCNTEERVRVAYVRAP